MLAKKCLMLVDDPMEPLPEQEADERRQRVVPVVDPVLRPEEDGAPAKKAPAAAPKNRHERRRLAALARKGGGR